MCLLLVFGFDCDALFVFECQVLCVSLFCHFAYVKCFHVSALSWLVIVPNFLFCFGSLLSSCVDFFFFLAHCSLSTVSSYLSSFIDDLCNSEPRCCSTNRSNLVALIGTQFYS